jgi:chromosomal replication initiation ATPase DnaA
MPELRLDSFEVDESNKFALALCKAVVNLEKGYSPLLIHGQQGSGKTHLLLAVNSELTLAHPEISLLYISDHLPIEKLLFGEESSGSNGGSEEFIYKTYSRKDLLIVDDIERFSDDSKIRERFYALFDTFVDNGKQVLLASSLPIEELRGFDKRFFSRLRGGIDAPLSTPQPETLLRILKRECEQLGLRLDVNILQKLMLEAGKDVAYLKKLPGHLKTFATLTRQTLTKEKVDEFLSVIRSEAGEDKGATTAEQIYGSWVQSQAKKREGDFNATIQRLEEKLSEQLKQTQKLKSELEAAKSREQAAVAEVSELSAHIQAFKQELSKKDNTLQSQEKLISSEIADLTKEVEKRDKLDARKGIGQSGRQRR